jgi:uncharacterized protein DUF6390
VTTWSPGERLFAQYAHAPNALGFCGPQTADGLLRGARGEDPDLDVAAVARGFSGAWPYQQIIAELTQRPDPLEAEVVRAYWTGNALTRQIAPELFLTALLDRFRPQAGRYWEHLTDALAAEASATHVFHVLAIYPWSRLLPSGPDALSVLESCRIGWGRVESVDDQPVGRRTVEVRQPVLAYDGALTLSLPETRSVTDDGFAGTVRPGDTVAVHWGRVCDRLTTEEAQELEHWTRWQLDASNPRILGASAP